jgi:hypothetical protein
MKNDIVDYHHLLAYVKHKLQSEDFKQSEYLQETFTDVLNYIRYQYLYNGKTQFDFTQELNIGAAPFYEWFFSTTEFNQGESK